MLHFIGATLFKQVWSNKFDSKFGETFGDVHKPIILLLFRKKTTGTGIIASAVGMIA